MTPDDKTRKIEEARKKGHEYTSKYFSCSLGTNLALQETFGVDDESMFKAASGLHGGIGGKGDVCGALLGASLMLGYTFGKSRTDMDKAKAPPEHGQPDDASRLVAELYDWFKDEFGSVKCDDVRERNKAEVNADPATAGLTEEEKMPIIFKKCDVLAGKTAGKAAEMIWDERVRGGD